MKQTSQYLSLLFFLGIWSMNFIPVQAQKESNIWYFGYNCGVDFNSGKPVALTDGKIATREGCATISTRKGELLFYTDGISVWNRKHNVMSNGTGLKGNSSSTQSAVVAQMPVRPLLYYIFTVDDIGGSDGLQYSIVDMSKDNGYGEIITKNVMLNASTCEKIAVVSHQNKRDYWILMHEVGNDKFNAYLLTSTGISTSPVVSNVGPVIKQNNSNYTLGYLKPSRDGKKLICANFALNTLLYDFNDANGAISNPLVLDLSIGSASYGAEFSANSKVVYVGDYYGKTIYQFNVDAGSNAKIIQSKFKVDESATYGAMQLATDDKIYITEEGRVYLHSIENPNKLGASCDFKLNTVNLENKRTALGLPTFVSTLNYPIVYRYLCLGDSTEFEVISSLVDSIHWDFGDVNSKAGNQSRLLKPKHRFTEVKKYEVTAIVFYDTLTDTLRQEIEIVIPEKIFIGNDTTICGDSLKLQILGQAGPFLWQDGSNTAEFVSRTSGTYSVQAGEGACSTRDTINIFFRAPIGKFLGNDTSLCFGDSLAIDATTPNALYDWNDSSNLPIKKVYLPGLFWVDITADNCKSRDSIFVDFKPIPDIELGPDTIICNQPNYSINLSGSYDSILWYDGSNVVVKQIIKPGKYWVEVGLNQCFQSDSINIDFDFSPTLNLPEQIELCQPETYLVKVTSTNAKFMWQDGSTESSFILRQPGWHWVKATNRCGETIDSVEVLDLQCDCILTLPNIITPNSDGLNDDFQPVEMECDFKMYHMLIFNRWGELVFESTDASSYWDAKVNGVEAVEGTYFYLLESVSSKDKKINTSGTLTVLR